jgi:hypothetical protein
MLCLRQARKNDCGVQPSAAAACLVVLHSRATLAIRSAVSAALCLFNSYMPPVSKAPVSGCAALALLGVSILPWQGFAQGGWQWRLRILFLSVQLIAM